LAHFPQKYEANVLNIDNNHNKMFLEHQIILEFLKVHVTLKTGVMIIFHDKSHTFIV